MRITDLLLPEAVRLHASPADKSAVIDLLADLHERAGNISDKEGYKKEIWAREALDSTAVGDGVAVPHARCAAVKRASLAAVTVPGGLDYDSPDGEPSKLFFMIAAPEGGGDVHMDMLAHLMVMLMDEEFCQKLLDTGDVKTFLELIDAQERIKFPEEAPARAEQPKEGLRVLAITACPTGIAHTYMAAEALEKKGRELNIGVKAETQGSGGAKNILTREEIAACDGIIMALSFLLDGGAAGTAAFGSSTPLAAFFNKAGNLAFSFMVPILSAFIAQSIADRPGLMVGFVGGSLAASGATFAYFADPTVPIIPAGFLGGLLAGFVGGWFMKWLRKACDKLPQSLEGLKPILIYPVAGLLFIGAFMCLVNPFVGMLNSALTNALSMAFGCASPAPHGGLFVFPVMQNPLGYAAAIAIGSVAGMFMLGLLKKKKV